MRENFTRYRFNRELVRDSMDICEYEYGNFTIEEAILLTDLAVNIAGIKNYRKKLEGWYYTTLDQLHSRHPYISRSSINRIMKKLRAGGFIKASSEHNRKRYDKTLWYSFANTKLFRTAVSKEDCITYIANDAKLYGIEAAILLSNIKYWEQYNEWDLNSWFEMNPAELADDGYISLPIKPYTIRRALAKLVAAGALERKFRNKKGNACYLYRTIKTRHEEPKCKIYEAYANEGGKYNVYVPILPTESFEDNFTDELPTECYLHLN